VQVNEQQRERLEKEEDTQMKEHDRLQQRVISIAGKYNLLRSAAFEFADAKDALIDTGVVPKGGGYVPIDTPVACACYDAETRLKKLREDFRDVCPA